MSAPDLQALRQGDAGAWDAAFDWLRPTALAVVRLKLLPFLPGEVEDVTIGALEQLKPEQRAIMMDFYLHGLSYEQISISPRGR